MIRKWLDTAEVVAFGEEIARDADRLFRPDKSRTKRPSAAKEQKRFDGIVRRTRAFVLQHELNVYKRAKLLNTIKWNLREAGHTDSVIDELIAVLAPLLV